MRASDENEVGKIVILHEQIYLEIVGIWPQLVLHTTLSIFTKIDGLVCLWTAITCLLWKFGTSKTIVLNWLQLMHCAVSSNGASCYNLWRIALLISSFVNNYNVILKIFKHAQGGRFFVDTVYNSFSLFLNRCFSHSRDSRKWEKQDATEKQGSEWDNLLLKIYI